VLGCQGEANFEIRSQSYSADKFVKYWQSMT